MTHALRKASKDGSSANHAELSQPARSEHDNLLSDLSQHAESFAHRLAVAVLAFQMVREQKLLSDGLEREYGSLKERLNSAQEAVNAARQNQSLSNETLEAKEQEAQLLKDSVQEHVKRCQSVEDGIDLAEAQKHTYATTAILAAQEGLKDTDLLDYLSSKKPILHQQLFKSEAWPEGSIPPQRMRTEDEIGRVLVHLSKHAEGVNAQIATCVMSRMLYDEHYNLYAQLSKTRDELQERQRINQLAIEKDQREKVSRFDTSLHARTTEAAEIEQNIKDITARMEKVQRELNIALPKISTYERGIADLAESAFAKKAHVLDTIVDRAQVRQRLFASSDELDPTQPPSTEEGPPTRTAEEQLQTDAGEVAKQAILTERTTALRNFWTIHRSWTSHMDSYRTDLDLHNSGNDPGTIPEWSPSWPKEEFDLRRLKQGMTLTTQLRHAENRLTRCYAWAKDVGLEPIEGQFFHFADHPDDGSDLEAYIAAAPRTRVQAWIETVPSTPGKLAGSAAMTRPTTIESSPALSSPPLGVSMRTVGKRLNRRLIERAGTLDQEDWKSLASSVSPRRGNEGFTPAGGPMF